MTHLCGRMMVCTNDVFSGQKSVLTTLMNSSCLIISYNRAYASVSWST
jgi:hypothetical protein